MPYESTITFTLDTICPWTYLGYLRLSRALSDYASAHPPGDPNTRATFILKFAPYQLYPDFSQDGEDKYEWYLREKYNNDTALMNKYTAYMSALGRAEGVEFEFGGGGMIANTLHAHRVVQWVQEERGAEIGRRVVECRFCFVLSCLVSLVLILILVVIHLHLYACATPYMLKILHRLVSSCILLSLLPTSNPLTNSPHTALYSSYFTQSSHPSSIPTLLTACQAAGLSQQESKTLVEDQSEGLTDVKSKIREQAGNGVDSVPYVVFEGRRRDFTLVGAKEVGEYAKVLESVAREV
jgi:predicted DsbA family dithiol-disulfide isomerase